MDIKSTFIGVIAFAALAVGIASYVHSPMVVPVPSDNQSLGASPVQATDGTCLLSPGGGHLCSYAGRAAQASTTFMFKSPNATSTLDMASACSFNNTFGGSFDGEWGYSANIDATTTRISYKNPIISAGNKATVPATTSPSWTSGLDSPLVIPPNSFVAMKIGTSTSVTLQGNCHATVSY